MSRLQAEGFRFKTTHFHRAVNIRPMWALESSPHLKRPLRKFGEEESREVSVGGGLIRNSFAHGGFCQTQDEYFQLPLNLEGMRKEEYEEYFSTDEDIPVAATPTRLEICQSVLREKNSSNKH
ncbi:hypothetical protein AVEN_68515-1 [Araneus ventricosus]|uniref:Uncharacterized protein n=1 Tax=Araneus ventricosus TaxID=182803 RepID=A0A4Y2N4K3_ARAVE|nr:hypothetical protein AVEN_68515-1 [Araneus ventricosus]